MPAKTLINKSTNRTLYTLTIATNSNRTSRLHNKLSFVNLAVINDEGIAFLHSFCPAIEGVEAERNSIDTLTFSGNNIGSIKNVLISPEDSTWGVKEITIQTLDIANIEIFVPSISDSNEPILFTHKLPTQSHIIQDIQDIQDYTRLTQEVSQHIIALASLGTLITIGLAGTADACYFAGGSLVGLMHFSLLQNKVNSLVYGSNPKAVSQYIQSMALGACVYIGVMFSLANKDANLFNLSQLLYALVGASTPKLALIIASIQSHNRRD
jgi:hypothetical protein